MSTRHSYVAVVLCAASLVPSAAHADFFASSTGLSNAQHVVTFSEITFPQNTVITNQYASYGVTFSGLHFDSQGSSTFPGISGHYLGVSTTSPFSIFFTAPVTQASFGYAKNPATVTFQALLNGNVVGTATQAITYSNASTGYVGFKNITFDQIRVNSGTTEGLIDNVQFGAPTNNVILATPEPSTYVALVMGILGIVALAFKARRHSRSQG